MVVVMSCTTTITQMCQVPHRDFVPCPMTGIAGSSASPAHNSSQNAAHVQVWSN